MEERRCLRPTLARNVSWPAGTLGSPVSLYASTASSPACQRGAIASTLSHARFSASPSEGPGPTCTLMQHATCEMFTDDQMSHGSGACQWFPECFTWPVLVFRTRLVRGSTVCLQVAGTEHVSHSPSTNGPLSPQEASDLHRNRGMHLETAVMLISSMTLLSKSSTAAGVLQAAGAEPNSLQCPATLTMAS